jgi:hypothetical protein
LDQCYPNLGENEVEVKGQAISPNTIVYYYTYGSVLSALSRPKDNKCGDAMQVLSQVRTELNANPDSYTEARSTILNIVQAGEAICQSLAEGQVPASSVPTDAIGGLYGATTTPSP